jgi:NADH dehydrogenase
MVLVVGSTGLLGGEVARQLSAKGVGVRGLARASADATKVAGLEKAGVSVCRGDLRQPETLAAACRGVESVVTTVSAMPFSWKPGNTIHEVDRKGQMALIDAAQRAGVRRLVYISFPHDAAVSFPLGDAKIATEKHLKGSGLEYTVLQANYFMEVWLSPALGFDYGSCKATVFGEGANKLSWVSFRDVARTAVEAVSSPKARNAVLPVGGPRALSPQEVIAVFEKQGGSSWQVSHVPVDALRKQKADAADEVQESIAGLQIMYATSAAVAMDARDFLVGDNLVSVADYAASVVKKGAAVV